MALNQPDIARLSDLNVRLMSEVQTLRAERDGFRQDVARKRATITTLGSELAEAQSRIDELQSELTDLRHRLSQADAIESNSSAQATITHPGVWGQRHCEETVETLNLVEPAHPEAREPVVMPKKKRPADLELPSIETLDDSLAPDEITKPAAVETGESNAASKAAVFKPSTSNSIEGALAPSAQKVTSATETNVKKEKKRSSDLEASSNKRNTVLDTSSAPGEIAKPVVKVEELSTASEAALRPSTSKSRELGTPLMPKKLPPTELRLSQTINSKLVGYPSALSAYQAIDRIGTNQAIAYPGALSRDHPERTIFPLNRVAPARSQTCEHLVRPEKKRPVDLDLPSNKRVKVSESASAPGEISNPGMIKMEELAASLEPSASKSSAARTPAPSLRTQPAAVSKPTQTIISRIECYPSALFVPRIFLANMFGGSPFNPIQCIDTGASSSGPSRTRYFAFPTFYFSPNLPKKEGLYGEIQTVSTDLLDLEHFALFSTERGNSGWQYKGEYKATISHFIPIGVFRSMKRKAKDDWVGEIKWKAWNAKIRARIHLRLKRVEITDSSIAGVMRERTDNLTLDDIMGSLERGEEQITVLGLTCVGFDGSLAATINQAYIDQSMVNRNRNM